MTRTTPTLPFAPRPLFFLNFPLPFCIWWFWDLNLPESKRVQNHTPHRQIFYKLYRRRKNKNAPLWSILSWMLFKVLALRISPIIVSWITLDELVEFYYSWVKELKHGKITSCITGEECGTDIINEKWKWTCNKIDVKNKDLYCMYSNIS